jgi:hypothetical protein
LADFVILYEKKSLLDAALDPSYARTTVYRGKVVGWRKVDVGPKDPVEAEGAK